MNYRRLTQLYKIFPFKVATAFTICEATHYFAPYIRFSYAWAAEDIMLQSIILI